MVTAHLGWHIKLTIIACKEDRQFPNLVARIVSVYTQWRKHEVDCSIFSYPLNISWSTCNSSHNMEPWKPQKCIHIHIYEHPCPPPQHMDGGQWTKKHYKINSYPQTRIYVFICINRFEYWKYRQSSTHLSESGRRIAILILVSVLGDG